MHMKFETEIPKQNLSYAAETMSPTESRNPKNLIWPQGSHLEMRELKINRILLKYTSIEPLKFQVHIQSQTKESGNLKIQYGCQAAILKLTPLKINRLLPIYISTVPLKFEADIQSQTKIRVLKPKNPIWPTGGHFEINVTENQ